jgi:chromosome segregation ATPase
MLQTNQFACLFLLYDIGMLEDLDHLSTRLAKLLAYTQQLFAEQTALQSRLAQAEAERDAFRAQLALEGTQAQVLSRKAQTASSERDVLQGSLDLFRQEHQTLQTQLAARDKEVTALRDVTAQARQRIDAVLERLPGATQTEEKQ